MELEAGSTGTLMTYLHQGRQFVVMPVAGRPAGQMVAFALPQAAPAGGRGGRGNAPAPAEQ